MKLYEITDEIRSLERFLEGEDVDQESFDAAIHDLADERDTKIANIGLLVKEWRADIAARKELVKSLQDRNKTTQARIDWMTGYVLNNIEAAVKTPVVSVSKQKGRVSLSVQDDAQLPDRFYRKEVNKTELKEAVVAGEEYYGVSLEPGSPYVVIR